MKSSSLDTKWYSSYRSVQILSICSEKRAGKQATGLTLELFRLKPAEVGIWHNFLSDNKSSYSLSLKRCKHMGETVYEDGCCFNGMADGNKKETTTREKQKHLQPLVSKKVDQRRSSTDRLCSILEDMASSSQRVATNIEKSFAFFGKLDVHIGKLVDSLSKKKNMELTSEEWHLSSDNSSQFHIPVWANKLSVIRIINCVPVFGKVDSIFLL